MENKRQIVIRKISKNDIAFFRALLIILLRECDIKGCNECIFYDLDECPVYGLSDKKLITDKNTSIDWKGERLYMKIKVTDRDILLLKALRYTVKHNCKFSDCDACTYKSHRTCPVSIFSKDIILTNELISNLKGAELDTPD